MTEDAACELLITQRAYWMYGLGWRIVLEKSPYGDTARDATPNEARVLEKVKATVMGQPDISDTSVAY